MTDLRHIAAAMGGEVNGNSVAFPTPGHSKHDRGTVLTLDPDAPDGALVHSFNGGDPLAIKDILRAKGVLPERKRTGDGWRDTGTYCYRDESGAVLYRTVRKEKAGEHKRFIAERLQGGGWAKGLGDAGEIRRVLYRLPELLKADSAEPVYLVEGERKADKLAGWGFTATAIAFGAKGWHSRHRYGEALKDRMVVILPDNDKPGREFAEIASAAIKAAGGTVHILDLPDLPPKGDIIDWRGTAEQLRELTDAVLHAPPEVLETIPRLDFATLANVPPETGTFALEKFIPRGEVTLFTGPGGSNKSLFGQQLATAIAAGVPFLGLETMHAPALYITAEDSERELHWRHDHIRRRLGVAFNLPNLHLSSLRGRLDNALCTFNAEGRLLPSQTFRILDNTIRASGAGFVVLDNVAHLFLGNENDRSQVTQFANLLNRLAEETGATILLVAHPNKAGDSYSGSTAWLNAVRSQIVIECPRDSLGETPDPDARELRLDKANYARLNEKLRFRWHDFALVLEDDLPKDQRTELAANIRANNDNAIFLSCLQELTRRQQPVSESIASRTYAPLVFSKMPEAKGIGKARLEAAMDRLFRIDAIERGFLWRSDRKDRFGLREKRADPCADPAPTRCADPAPTPTPTALHTHPISYGYTGRGLRPAAPDPDDLDWGDDGEGGI